MLYFIIIAVILLIISAYYLLIKLDKHTDYVNKSIKFQFVDDNNGLYVRVPYFTWQIEKQNVIKELFSEKVIFEGKEYNTIAIFKEQPHSPLDGDVFPASFYKDFVVKVEPKCSIQHKSITNTTYIHGDNNKVIINQNELHTITNHIDQLLQTDISLTDKQCLELFKYKLMDNNISETDKNRVLSVLNKLSKYAPYASLSTTIINLVKSLLL